MLFSTPVQSVSNETVASRGPLQSMIRGPENMLATLSGGIIMKLACVMISNLHSLKMVLLACFTTQTPIVGVQIIMSTLNVHLEHSTTESSHACIMDMKLLPAMPGFGIQGTLLGQEEK